MVGLFTNKERKSEQLGASFFQNVLIWLAVMFDMNEK
jgi:hypothetical protein